MQTSKVDTAALKAKYIVEREKRLRADGPKQYQKLEDKIPHVMDPFMPVTPREPKRDHVTCACIGGGFAGLVTGARLVEAGIKNVRIVEIGGDFGGTWYWNRYPGAQCDTSSFVYLPLCEETGHMPTEKYVHRLEIFEHAQRIGKHYCLYKNALFHTKVQTVTWDESASYWIIRTDRNDEFTAQFVCIGLGTFRKPKLPAIPGIETFKGRSFHTKNWDYEYTGGDAERPMLGLANKRVAIIGTGATSVQVVPRVAQDAKEVFVFQRTPASVDVRNNHPIDPAWFAEMATPGWQQRYMDSFATNVSPGVQPPKREDIIQDGWTDVSRRIYGRVMVLPEDMRTDAKARLAILEESDFEKMEEIRSRVDNIVTCTATAEKLKAWYYQLCKRPCFHDEYLQAFNKPSVHLVDTDGKGVQKVTETSVVVADQEYPVDCIVYASGFNQGEKADAVEIVGKNGLSMACHWAHGMRTMHGVHMCGFPNLSVVQPFQGPNLIANITSCIDDTAKTIAATVKHTLSNKFSQFEVRKEAEDAWLQFCASGPPMNITLFNDCTPSYYNAEGTLVTSSGGKVGIEGHPGGAFEHFQHMDRWRQSFDGLAFSSLKRSTSLTNFSWPVSILMWLGVIALMIAVSWQIVTTTTS